MQSGSAGLLIVHGGAEQALQAILRSSQMAKLYLFNFAVGVERTALRPEVLIYIEVCTAGRPGGLLRVSVLCLGQPFGI